MSKVDSSPSLYGTAKAEKPLQTQKTELCFQDQELAKADDPLTEEQKQRIKELGEAYRKHHAIKEMQELNSPRRTRTST